MEINRTDLSPERVTCSKGFILRLFWFSKGEYYETQLYRLSLPEEGLDSCPHRTLHPTRFERIFQP